MWEPITAALSTICCDSMGKDAVKSSLKEIKMIPTSGDMDFNGGVLTIHSDLTGNGHWTSEQIQEKLEKGL